MKTFKRHITEALDKPYPIRSINKGSHQWLYDFKTSSGVWGQGDFAQIGTSTNPEGRWITFAFDIGGEISTTGTGDQFRIFATVKEMIIHFFDEYPHQIRKFSFSASKQDGSSDIGRVRLYKRFAKQIAKEYGFTLKTSEDSHDVDFDLIRKK